MVPTSPRNIWDRLYVACNAKKKKKKCKALAEGKSQDYFNILTTQAFLIWNMVAGLSEGNDQVDF